MEFCFGCGEDNPVGLHLVFEERADGSVASRVELSADHSGEPGIVHGGIQATVLDEVMGRAVQRRLRDLGRTGTAVTANFELKYRRACPTGVALSAEGRVRDLDWPSVHVEGGIVDGSGTPLTEAVARWRVLDTGRPPVGA